MTSEEARKNTIRKIFLHMIRLKEDTYLIEPYTLIVLNYELPDNFKNLHPIYFIWYFLRIIDLDHEQKLVPITETLYDLLVKIMTFNTDHERYISFFLKKLDVYRLCVDIGYKNALFGSDYLMSIRLGADAESISSYNEGRYVARYLTTV